MVQVEHDFTLPVGLLGEDGALHREGTMRLATAADEILPLQDPRVQRNPAYLTVILLSRVITRLDGIEPVTPQHDRVAVRRRPRATCRTSTTGSTTWTDRTHAGRGVCPSCGEALAAGRERLGESVAIPSIA